MKSNYPPWPLIKFVLTLVTLGFLAAGWWSIAPRRLPSKHRGTAVVVTLESLNKEEARINKEYFQGKLPKTTVEWFNADDSIGLTTCGEDSCNIYLNPKYNLAEVQAEMSLFHETCHVATYTEDFEHGHKWQGCMHRLAMEGAFESSW